MVQVCVMSSDHLPPLHLHPAPPDPPVQFVHGWLQDTRICTLRHGPRYRADGMGAERNCGERRGTGGGGRLRVEMGVDAGGEKQEREQPGQPSA